MEYEPNKIVHLTAEVTRACNLRCDYCFNASGVMMHSELKLDEWKQAIDVTQKYGAESALFTGGEVMARNDSPELIGYALDRGLRTSILSNGLRLNSQSSDMLQKLERVQISLDSASPYSHDARRGDGSWKVARQAIDYMRGLGVPVEISATISANHLDELEGLVGIAYLTESSLLVRPMQYVGRVLGNAKQDLNRVIVEKKQRLEDKFGEIFVEDFARYVPVLGENHDERVLPEGFVTVLPDGKIRGTRQSIFDLEKAA
ncbi:radical SAM protein [Candidatus Woesearchaeota archaeon]|nr:radical SAM protein [Candidatus Woesearchaeota archaeon]